MQLFINVVEEGSFAAAARKSRMSTTAASNHVQALETWTGARLFNRSTRRVVLTEPGAAFYEACQRVLREIAAATDVTRSLQTTPRGKLRVSSPGAFGIEQLSSVLAEFSVANPLVELVLDLNDRHVDVLSERYDLALFVGTLPDSTLSVRRLAPIRFITCASPSYLARAGEPASPADLVKHACLNYNGYFWSETEWRYLDSDGTTMIVPVNVKMISSTSVLKRAACRGAGLLQCPTYAVAGELRDGLLVPVLTAFRNPEFSLFAVNAQGKSKSATLQLLIDFLAARFGPEPPWDRDYSEIRDSVSGISALSRCDGSGSSSGIPDMSGA